ncbi:sulfotransferase family 2 domain-containing protein [Pontimonas salivibrio]|uniref:sulfotransferase family 2 domain-containing protein n=1 Tax=Pontimonas salivibrio TaxID=1159327 RepID=UPI000CF35E8A|nr:sulfotransferase family 2 domain-containing protein [Pontimonas salivibrio]
MVLISFEHRFILLKSIKTAGTSVEATFMKALAPNSPMGETSPEFFSDKLYCSERRTRGKLAEGFLLKPHCSLAEAREKFPIIRDFDVIVCIRNPYERFVSFFWWKLKKFPRWYRTLSKSPRLIQRISVNFFILFGPSPKYFPILELLSNPTSPPEVIRYENLGNDVARILERLGVENQTGVFQLKTGLNPSRKEDARGYLWKQSRKKAQDVLGWEFDTFGYLR